MSQIGTSEQNIIKPSMSAVPPESVKAEPIVRHLFAKVFSRSYLQGTVVLFDQGFCSIASFLTGVMVARACGDNKGEYGLYVLGLTLLLTLQFVQRCLVSIPFTVHSPHLNGRDHATYLGSTLIHHLMLSGIAALSFAILAAVVTSAGRTDCFPNLLFALAAACVFVLLRDYTRYILLAQLRVWASLQMGLAANVTTIGFLFWAYKDGWLTAPVAYFITGGCSGLPAIIMLLTRSKNFSFDKNRFIGDLRINWHFGKWTLAATGASTLGIQSIPWFVLFWYGSVSVAVFGALLSVAGIISPAILGVTTYLTPKLVHQVKTEGLATAMRKGLMMVKIMAVFAVLYIIFICALGEKIVGILYTVRYQGHLSALVIIAVGTGLGAINITLTALIRATGNPEIEFWSSGYASIVCILISISLIPMFGIVGAAMAMTGSNLAFAAITRLQKVWMTQH